MSLRGGRGVSFGFFRPASPPQIGPHPPQLSHEKPKMTDTPESPSRRNWLLRMLETGIAATVVAILYPVVRFLWPREATKSGAMEMIAPYRVNELKPLANGQWLPPFEFGGKPCLLIRTPDGEIKAFNAICTHVDCTVEYRPDHGDIFCNCHDGLYDLNGQRASGPPPRPLQAYKVALGEGDPGQEEIIVFTTS